ncbi:hypothetical protein ASE65_14925 [Sphingomonas sp. Leaf16]|nr:hypothetical protein ASE65_14925 [Sphingomonas sp. Leaf16]KQN17127.1 hypothetical protein ASE81_14970 [Sphingomonas sp. Leaf29]
MVVVSLWGLRSALIDGPVQLVPLWLSLQQSLFVIVVGTCIAMPFCLLIGLPLWHFAIVSGQQQRRDALRFGLMTGALIGAVMAVIGDPWVSTPEEAFDFLGYCLAGLCAGSIAHRAAYPP